MFQLKISLPQQEEKQFTTKLLMSIEFGIMLELWICRLRADLEAICNTMRINGQYRLIQLILYIRMKKIGLTYIRILLQNINLINLINLMRQKEVESYLIRFLLSSDSHQYQTRYQKKERFFMIGIILQKVIFQETHQIEQQCLGVIQKLKMKK